MTWSKIVGVLKRLDSRLSDSVYLHGCYLTGQEKIPSSSFRQSWKSFTSAVSRLRMTSDHRTHLKTLRNS